MSRHPEDDWIRPVPRSSRDRRARGHRDDPERTRAVPQDPYDDPQRTRAMPRGSRHDQGYDDPYSGRDREYDDRYNERGDYVPRGRTTRQDDRSHSAYDDYDRAYDERHGRGYDARGGRRQADRGPAPRPAPRPPRRRPRYGFRRFMALLAFLVVAYLVSMVVVVAMIWGSIDKVDAEPDVADRPTGSAGAAYLLVGTDSREQLTAEQRNEYGTGTAEGTRADTIMLLHVPTSGEPTLVSLPRDSYVPIRDHGWNKLNAAHSIGGPELLVDTVEQNTGIGVDGYIEIGFGGFVDVVETVGGVRMCLDEPIQDDKAHIDLSAGCQELTGTEALGYVRMRYSDPRGDIGRVERQREFLSALVGRMASPSTVLVPWRLHSVGTATGNALAMGEDTSVVDAARMAWAMKTVAGGGGASLTVPVADLNYQTEVGSSVLWDEQGAARLFETLRNGEPVSVEP